MSSNVDEEMEPRLSRRGLLVGLGSTLILITSPAIVRASSLMAVRVMPLEEEFRMISLFSEIVPEDIRHAAMIRKVRRAFVPKFGLMAIAIERAGYA